MTRRGQQPENREQASEHTANMRKSTGSRRLTLLIVALTVIVALVDQLTKIVALDKLDVDVQTIWFVGELLGWKLLFNSGAALSIGTGMTWVLTIVAVAIVVVVARLARRIDSLGWALAFGFLLGGACGNLIDRFFREPSFASGHVVDFINYAGFFVGNVADVAIVLAAGLIILLSIRGVTIAADGTDNAAVPDTVSSDQDDGTPTSAEQV